MVCRVGNDSIPSIRGSKGNQKLTAN